MFDQVFVEIDEEEDLVDLIVKTLKDKGKLIDESEDKKSSRKKRHRDETTKERQLRKALKRSKRDKEKRKKRVKDEAIGMSTSSAQISG